MPPHAWSDTLAVDTPAVLAFVWVGGEHAAMWLNRLYPEQCAKIRKYMDWFDRFKTKDKRFAVLRRFNSSRWAGRK